MRHLKKDKRFGIKKGPHKSFIKGLAANLILRERIETTEARAKAIRPVVEKLVTIAKKQNLASLRLLNSRLPKDAAMNLYYNIGQKYQDRNGGYLRIMKTGYARKRDGAQTAIIEFVK